MHTVPPPSPPPPPVGLPPLYGPNVAEVTKEPRTPISLTWPLVGATVLAAVIGDVAFHQPALNTVAAFVFVCASAVAVAATGGIRTGYGRLFLLASLVFAGFLMVRSDPRLIIFDAIAAYVLLMAAAVFGRGGNPFDSGPFALAKTTVDAITSWFGLAVDVPLDLHARGRDLTANRTGLASLVGAISRGVVVAVPVVLVLGILLASADAVFASFFSFEAIPFGDGVVHVCFFLYAASLIIVIQQRAKGDPLSLTPRSTLTFGSVESVVVLAGLDVLFALFAVAQVLVALGNGKQAMVDAGMTYSSYARNGFFQLLWVAGITLIILMGLRTLTARSEFHQRLLRNLSQLASLMTLGIVGVAISRLWLYIGDTGLTPLRFYSSVFSGWVGLAFLIVMLRTAGFRKNQAWLTPVVLISGLATLLALNLANPEAIMASTNLKFDNDQTLLQQQVFTADAISVLATRIEDVPESARPGTAARLCARQDEFSERGMFGFNFSEQRAHDALNALCSG